MDADSIYREVERRKKRVEILKLRETVWSLYEDYLRRYPEWLKHSPDFIYPRIKNPVQVAPNHLEIIIDQDRYTFLISERRSTMPDEHVIDTIITLALHINDAVVFQFDIHSSVNSDEWDYSCRYTVWDTHTFIEGPWTEELKWILQAVEQQKADAVERAQKQRREDPKALEDLKKRFGL